MQQQILGLLCLVALSAAAPACPNVMCHMDCANGIKYVNGCPTCECNPAPACPLVMCKMDCDYGVKYLSGCPTCECNEITEATECQQAYAEAMKSKKYGQQVFTCDEQGNYNTLQTWENLHACVDSSGTVLTGWVNNPDLKCDCALELAEVQKSAMIGTFIPTCDAQTGLYQNYQCSGSTGYCWCADQNTGKQIGTQYAAGTFDKTKCASNIQTLKANSCPLVMCHMDCKNGIKYDSNGCPTCQCNPELQVLASELTDCQKKYAAAQQSHLMGQKVFTCDDQGNYNTLQTWENLQACVDSSGTVLTGWVSNPDLKCDCALDLAQTKKSAMIGTFVPTCDAQTGLYQNYQCSGSTGYCWCADQNTGKQIGTQYAAGTFDKTKCASNIQTLKTNSCPLVMCHMDCKNGIKYDSNGCPTCQCNPEIQVLASELTDCQKKYAAAQQSHLMGQKVFTCDDEGNYNTVQTWENMNACVDSDGNVVSDWVKNPNLDCKCPLEAASIKKTAAIGTFVPQCDSQTGFYQEYQCSGSTGYCWCVNVATGAQQGESYPPGQFDKICNPIQSLAVVNTCPLLMCKEDCEFGILYENGCPTCNCKTSDQATDCQTKYAAAKKSPLMGQKVFTCDEQGNYNTLQTWENLNACVDSDGNVVSEWVSNPQLNCACSLDAASKQKTAAIGTFVPKCDAATGNYNEFQCSGSTGYCWCVDVNTGKQYGDSYPPGKFDFNCHPLQSLVAKACPLVMCKEDCEFGVLYSNGCPTCNCKDQSQATDCQTKYAAAKKSPLMGQKVFTCDEQGNYNTLQTWENLYACVDSDGEVLTNWVTDKDLECTCALAAKSAKDSQKSSIGSYVPQCQADNGKFEEIQCNGSTGYCWCVSVFTGEKYGSSYPPGHVPLCHPF